MEITIKKVDNGFIVTTDSGKTLVATTLWNCYEVLKKEVEDVNAE